ncbi:MAG: hypothetical protein QOH35_3655 [Acidobacteriaceae bacterium]|nr:hypothetical protein [Acidobacteriaceae bacterium]
MKTSPSPLSAAQIFYPAYPNSHPRSRTRSAPAQFRGLMAHTFFARGCPAEHIRGSRTSWTVPVRLCSPARGGCCYPVVTSRVSMKHWLRGSQVSKARPGAPFAFFRHGAFRRSHTLFSPATKATRPNSGAYGAHFFRRLTSAGSVRGHLRGSQPPPKFPCWPDSVWAEPANAPGTGSRYPMANPETAAASDRL